jgi:uncharacterized protein YegP (UPF0339 family)
MMIKFELKKKLDDKYKFLIERWNWKEESI